MRPRGDSFLRHPLVLSFYLPSLIFGVSTGLLVPVLPLFAKELDPSYALIGLVLSAQALGMLIGDLPSGLLTRRMGQKQTMLAGAALAGLATVALLGVHSVALAVALRMLSGVGQALYTVSRHAYVAGEASMGVRGRAIALFGGLTRIGGFLGPLIGGAVAATWGLRSTFVVFGVANLAALLVMAIYVRATPVSRDGPQAVHSTLLPMLRGRVGLLTAAGVGQMLAQTIRAGRSAIIPLYAADVIGLGVEEIGFIVSLASAVDMTLFYPAGWIMDHLGRKYAIVPSFLVQAVGMALIPLAGGFGGLLAASALIGLGNGIGSGTMMTLGADLAPLESRGEFLGVWRLIGDAGSTSGPVIVGQVADLVALPSAALAMAAAGLCAAMVFGWLVPEPTKMKHPAPSTPSSQASRS